MHPPIGHSNVKDLVGVLGGGSGSEPCETVVSRNPGDCLRKPLVTDWFQLSIGGTDASSRPYRPCGFNHFATA